VSCRATGEVVPQAGGWIPRLPRDIPYVIHVVRRCFRQHAKSDGGKGQPSRPPFSCPDAALQILHNLRHGRGSEKERKSEAHAFTASVSYRERRSTRACCLWCFICAFPLKRTKRATPPSLSAEMPRRQQTARAGPAQPSRACCAYAYECRARRAFSREWRSRASK